MAFDVITPTKLYAGNAATSSVTIYTCPTSTRTIIKSIDIANTTASALTITLSAASSVLFPTISVSANDLLSWNGTHVLNATDTVTAYASASGVTIHMSGGECT